MISPGCLCLCNQTAAQLWVARGRHHDGLGWDLIGKFTNTFGRVAPTGRIAGEGDVVLVRDAETSDLGTTIEYGDVKHTVARDLGDSVELVTPEVSRSLRGGGALRLAAGNTVTMAKSDLALALMR
jgi:hypothetical protein